MTAQNEEVIHEGWGAFNRRDTAALLAGMSEDVVFRPPAHLVDDSAFHGHKGILAWLESVGQTWRELEGAPRIVASNGDRVLVEIELRGISLHGAPMVGQTFALYTMRAGKTAAVVTYADERDAREAFESGAAP